MAGRSFHLSCLQVGWIYRHDVLAMLIHRGASDRSACFLFALLGKLEDRLCRSDADLVFLLRRLLHSAAADRVRPPGDRTRVDSTGTNAEPQMVFLAAFVVRGLD